MFQREKVASLSRIKFDRTVEVTQEAYMPVSFFPLRRRA